MIVEITLSDNLPFKVRKLGIFELDELRPKPLGPFTYTMTVLGKEYQAEFSLENWPTPPPKPETPEYAATEHSQDWYAWHDYKLYQAAMLHQSKRHEQMAEFIENVARHIITNACEDDTNRIVTNEDWEKVYEAALIPQLTVEILSEVLAQTYQAEFEGVDVFQALENLKTESGGTYNTLRVWETKLMIELNLSELEYALIPLKERARKVCAMFLPEIMSSLEMERHRRIQDAKEGSKVNKK